jgi:ABC-type uncharacterized transport system permease subunit
MISVAILAMALYLIATWLQVRVFFKRLTLSAPIISIFVWPAILLHTVLLYFWIDGSGVPNLSPVNLFSLMMWLSSLLLVIAIYKKPLANLMILIFPLATLSIYLANTLTVAPNYIASPNSFQVIHVWLAILASSLLLLASVQALLISWQERSIRTKSPTQLSRLFPAVTVMESLLFEWLMLGFICLTALLLSSFWFFKNMIFSGSIKKTVFSMVAWLVIAGLLWGRHHYGWRGQTAVSWTLWGMLFLILAYLAGTVL